MPKLFLQGTAGVCKLYWKKVGSLLNKFWVVTRISKVSQLLSCERDSKVHFFYMLGTLNTCYSPSWDLPSFLVGKFHLQMMHIFCKPYLNYQFLIHKRSWAYQLNFHNISCSNLMIQACITFLAEDIEDMAMAKRISIMLDEVLHKRLREHQAKMIRQKKNTVTFSQVINEIIERGLENWPKIPKPPVVLKRKPPYIHGFGLWMLARKASIWIKQYPKLKEDFRLNCNFSMMLHDLF